MIGVAFSFSSSSQIDLISSFDFSSRIPARSRINSRSPGRSRLIYPLDSATVIPSQNTLMTTPQAIDRMIQNLTSIGLCSLQILLAIVHYLKYRRRGKIAPFLSCSLGTDKLIPPGNTVYGY